MLTETTTENVGEPIGWIVRSNRGRGGHAYQLANALNPIVGEQARKTNEGIPENIPENPMAPALRKGRSGKNGVISLLSLSIIIDLQIIPRSKTQK